MLGSDTMANIIVEKRSHDYMAYVEGDKRKWDCGVDFNQAVEELIITHDILNVESVIYDYGFKISKELSDKKRRANTNRHLRCIA